MHVEPVMVRPQVEDGRHADDAVVCRWIAQLQGASGLTVLRAWQNSCPSVGCSGSMIPTMVATVRFIRAGVTGVSEART
jgi:hypothetical protein